MANSVTRTLILEEVARRGWQARTIGRQAEILRVIHPDGRSVLLRGAMPSRSSAIGPDITKDKLLTLDFLRDCGYDVPVYCLADDEAMARDFLQAEQRIVVKPLDGRQSEGVTIDVTTNDQLIPALELARRHSGTGQALLQHHLDGNMYRLLAMNGTFVAATHRAGLWLIGDGQSTGAQLLEQLNQKRRAGEGAYRGLYELPYQDVAEYVGDAVMEGVVAAGTRLRIAPLDTAMGSDMINVTELVHDDWQRFAVEVTEQLGLFIAGFDIICADISQAMEGKYAPLLEINAMPGMRLHEYPTEGEPIHVIPRLLDELFS